MTASIQFDELKQVEILASNLPTAMEMVTIAAGQNLPRGAVLGRVTATKEYVLSLAASTDGSETPSAILEEAVDASVGADKGPAHLSGHFVARNLTFGTGHTAASTKDGLRAFGIYLDLAPAI
ncbi:MULTISPECIES: head decoration protein [unclassified Ensifer]|uniref:head decoration protein n=1 Tax=unclassified Ensifer TaxID=2633371 RepID=UPI000813A04A|nr:MULTISPECIES: head decoration protein [unclassified Ensifer]OCP07978.1 hypothetical protein BC362_10230 [Ensifer sp. LC14]OCP10912.1 hypothetical protein BC374_17735 [Ensifer sp. LC13]OCP11542.1 hypothetical protein BBX50_18120 [Ensifer sp. LC11]OCP33361.1 hypothetical protein BC364_17010 [Ensifer sp. LC499]